MTMDEAIIVSLTRACEASEAEVKRLESELKTATERAEKAERRAEAAVGDLETVGKNYNACLVCDMQTNLEGCLKRRNKLPRSVSCFKWREGEA